MGQRTWDPHRLPLCSGAPLWKQPWQAQSTGLQLRCEDSRHLHCKPGSETGIAFEE